MNIIWLKKKRSETVDCQHSERDQTKTTIKTHTKGYKEHFLILQYRTRCTFSRNVPFVNQQTLQKQTMIETYLSAG